MSKNSQKFIDFLENAATLGVAMCQEEGNIFYSNKTLSNLLGYSEEELKNLPFLSLFDLQHIIEQLKEKNTLV